MVHHVEEVTTVVVGGCHENTALDHGVDHPGHFFTVHFCMELSGFYSIHHQSFDIFLKLSGCNLHKAKENRVGMVGVRADVEDRAASERLCMIVITPIKGGDSKQFISGPIRFIDHRGEVAEQETDIILERLNSQLFLIPEVPVNRSFGKTGSPGQVGKTGARVSLFVEYRGYRSDDIVACCFDVGGLGGYWV